MLSAKAFRISGIALLAISMAAGLSGCDSLTGATANASSPARDEVRIDPHLDTQSELRLERFRRALQVGDEWTDAAEVFPALSGSYSFTDVPPGLPEDYEVKGWENRTEGFGAILFGNRVVAAMRQLEKIEVSRADQLRDAVLRDNRGRKFEHLTGPNVEFWFWQENETILMMMRRVESPERCAFVEALGTVEIMEFLQMNPAKARAIIERLQESPKDTQSAATTRGDTASSQAALQEPAAGKSAIESPEENR